MIVIIYHNTYKNIHSGAHTETFFCDIPHTERKGVARVFPNFLSLWGRAEQYF